MKLTGEYKGYKISIDDYDGKFEALIDNSRISSSTLPGLLKRIDALDKKDFVRTNVIARYGWHVSQYMTGQVTSHVSEREVWFISDKNKRRSKLSAERALLATDANKDRIAEIQKLQDALKRINQQIKDIEASFDLYEIK
jgi:hypothetical protein